MQGGGSRGVLWHWIVGISACAVLVTFAGGGPARSQSDLPDAYGPRPPASTEPGELLGPELPPRGPKPPVVDLAPQEPSDRCEVTELGLLELRALRRDVAEQFPWLTQAWLEGYPLACREPGGFVFAEIEFEPHLVRPRWQLYRELTCRRQGGAPWVCRAPEETTLVRLSRDHRGTIVFDAIPVDDALRALATVLSEAQAERLLDPFAPEDEPNVLEIPADSLLSVSVEEYCDGLLVTAEGDDEEALLELCVEPEACAETDVTSCAWRVRFQGRTGSV